MQAKVEKNLRNTINRQVNCETANMMKAADASAAADRGDSGADRQPGEDAFPGNLWETVRLRLEYPTDSLSELAQRFDPPISKPGLSHRLKKDHRACGKGGLNWYHLHICMSTANTACWTAPAVSKSWWTVWQSWGRPLAR